MAETLNKDALLGNALKTKFAVNPAAETVALKPPEPIADPVDFSAAKTDRPLPVKEDYMAAIKPDIDALRIAEEEKLKFAGLEKIDAANREAAKQKALGESAAQQRREILDDPSRVEYKQALEAKAKPFIPHEENAQDMMALFGLLNVVGFAIGAGGKEYSQAAMSAMNGMLEGHQKGRDDLYKREKSIFETNQKQLDSRIKQLLAFMQDNELLTNMDKTARDQAIQGKFLEDGATFLSEYYKKNGYGKTVETLKEMVKASSKAAELAAKETQRAAEQDFTLRLETQKAKEKRQEERDKVLAQYDLASLQLNEAAKRARADRDFRLEEDMLRRSFDMDMAKANWTHGENLAEINRKAAADIELARIERDKIRDKDTAEYRLKDKEYQEKRLKLEDDRYKETVRHDKKQEQIETARINAEKQPTNLYTDPKTGIAYQYDVNKRAWIPAPGLPTGVEKVGGGRKGSAQDTAVGVLQQDVENARYNLKDLKDLASPTGKLPGGSVAFAQKFTGDMTSMLMRYAANSNIDEGLQGMDALMLNLAFDIASAQSGGRGQLSDTKVRAVVSQMPLDEQPEATKATKWAALLERVDNANKTLPEGKKVEIPADVRSYYSRGRAGGGGKKPMPSEAKLKEYAKDPFFNGDIEKAKAHLRTQGYE